MKRLTLQVWPGFGPAGHKCNSKSTMLDKLEAIKARFEDLGVALTNPAVVSDNRKFSAMSKEYRSLERIVKAHDEYKRVLGDLEVYREALNGDDAELRELAKEELPGLEEKKT